MGDYCPLYTGVLTLGYLDVIGPMKAPIYLISGESMCVCVFACVCTCACIIVPIKHLFNYICV